MIITLLVIIITTGIAITLAIALVEDATVRTVTTEIIPMQLIFIILTTETIIITTAQKATTVQSIAIIMETTTVQVMVTIIGTITFQVIVVIMKNIIV